jgi:NAD(P)H-hydrate epimerase
MERAAKALTHAITEEWDASTPVVVFAGPGNNGGDALAVARMLAELNYKVSVYLFNIHNQLSEDCAANKKRLTDTKKLKDFNEITLDFDPPKLDASTLVVDGLFGTGLNKPLSGGFASLVRYINRSSAKVVSIDMPSGLMTEDNTLNVTQNIIRADLTLTIQSKKLSMLFADCCQFTGKIEILDINLSQEYINKTIPQYYIQEENDVRSRLVKRSDFAHKGTMGTALIIAGSYGMAGAAIMATQACLRSGVGKVIVRTPRNNVQIMQSTVPEAVVSIDRDEEVFSEAVDSYHCDAIGIGPGLGKGDDTAIALIAQMKSAKCPIIADADALNILASRRAWLEQLPKGVILTPHCKEMDRLSGTTSSSSYELLSKARDLAGHIEGYVLLKGHYSALCMPNGNVIFNATGNSGMATAGAGDVLTGIITGLLARGYNQQDACAIGMYVHGLAGDMAAERVGKESLMASDIIKFLPKAFKLLMGE